MWPFLKISADYFILDSFLRFATGCVQLLEKRSSLAALQPSVFYLWPFIRRLPSAFQAARVEIGAVESAMCGIASFVTRPCSSSASPQCTRWTCPSVPLAAGRSGLPLRVLLLSQPLRLPFLTPGALPVGSLPGRCLDLWSVGTGFRGFPRDLWGPQGLSEQSRIQPHAPAGEPQRTRLLLRSHWLAG